ncbi:MAG: hydroxyacid dehydrogenase [Opitutales bacterium]
MTAETAGKKTTLRHPETGVEVPGMPPPAVFCLKPFARDLVYRADVRERLNRLVDWPLGETPLDPETADDGILAGIEVILGSWGMRRLDPALLDRMPNLRGVFYGAGSIRRFTTDAFWERDIPVCSAWAMNAVPVAEYTFAQIILCLKHAHLQRHHYREADRAKRQPLDLGAHGTYGATVGLVSYGQIAKRVRERLASLEGVRVRVFDPFLSEADARSGAVERCDLPTLFSESDVVSIHTPWLPETEGLITGDLVSRLRPGGALINTARGAVVDEPGLTAVLRERPDLTAVLDVTFPEPPDPESPLFSLPNVYLTPHIAGSQDRECARMGHAMVDELERLLAGEPLQYAVSREQAKVMA